MPDIVISRARHPAGPWRLRPLVLALAVWTTGCASPLPPLSNTFPSDEALAAAVLGRFEQRDTAALRALAVSEQEFRDHVWPELPAARPERNLPFSYVWGDLNQKSQASLAQTLATWGGRRYELVEVRYGGDTTEYAGYKVHRRTELVVKDHGGAVQTLRLYGSTLEKQGTFKVFSFVVD